MITDKIEQDMKGQMITSHNTCSMSSRRIDYASKMWVL